MSATDKSVEGIDKAIRIVIKSLGVGQTCEGIESLTRSLDTLIRLYEQVAGISWGIR